MTPFVELKTIASSVVQPLMVVFVVLSLVIGTHRTLLTPRVLRLLRGRACRRVIGRLLRDELITALVVMVLGFLLTLYQMQVRILSSTSQDQDQNARVTRGNLVAVGVLGLMIFIAPTRMPADVKACATNLHEPADSLLLERSLMTVTTQSQVVVRRTASTMHVHVFSGTIRFNRRGRQGGRVATTTIVTTEQVQLAQVDATICVRVQGDRTLVSVMEGAVRMSALGLEEGSGMSGRNGVKARRITEMSLLSGDRAEVARNGADLVIRLRTGTGFPAECSLTWDWGFAVLRDGKALS